ncbi:3-phosphoshikimate 1-carboxyvinyltransferase [Membranicola marinus]|uniref:3-phosphoshikimate 1-carboxyvinyltransferase n=1 Tax=Membranihabitans marinus TaxID=1227546 RepID=A0A953HNB2_9BACT|nr:3-phosphoshikimate 1-carboxyvinyltransferase [Membranihabitans marinus]MBY5958264.1 3-phosphoshikimate 1-carboxyvinyltransferase [Membranihabitans marinus]
MSKQVINISLDRESLEGEIALDGSKSISNRALIIQALTEMPKPIHHLSTSNDTKALQHILNSSGDVFDAGAAGTTFRFLTAYLAASGKSCTLTGSERMKQRPIGELVEALRTLGANITYLGEPGYPPLRFEPATLTKNSVLPIASHISSQFISALLLIAPTLPGGLTLQLGGEMVSRSYIELTLQVMQAYGVRYEWKDNEITVPHQSYQGKEFTVESDWSAASYYYSIAALSDSCRLQLHGLNEKSFQGDAVLPELYESFGVHTTYTSAGITLTKTSPLVPASFEHNFILCPDIAQTIAVTCAGLGTDGLFSGLQTLSIKETDRIAALKTELAKLNVSFTKMPPKFSPLTGEEFYLVSGKAAFPETVTFPTYEDHRMAMAFAPLAVLHPVRIEEPDVVRKSYPDFWLDLERLGFSVEKG